MRMLFLALALSALGFGQVVTAPPVASAPSSAFNVPVMTSRGLSSWTAFDVAMPKGLGVVPTYTTSTGFALDAWPASKGNWEFHGVILTTAGVTSASPSTLVGSAGVAPTIIYKKHASVTIVMRQPTGNNPRIWTMMLGWKF